MQKGKPNHVSVFQASAFVIFSNISLKKQDTWPRPKSKGGEIYHLQWEVGGIEYFLNGNPNDHTHLSVFSHSSLFRHRTNRLEQETYLSDNHTEIFPDNFS